MATKEEYLAQGYTEQQIQDATVAKNTADMSAKLGQNLQATSYNVVPNPNPAPDSIAPTPAETPQPQKIEPISPVSPTPAPITPPQPETPKIEPVNIEKTTTTTPQGETVVKKETPAPKQVDFNV